MIPGQLPRRARSGLNGDPAAPARQIALLQLGIYSLVGGICFCIDVGGLVALRPLKLPILTASVLSFVTATLVNTLLCCGFVFRTGRFSRREEIVRHFVIALVGLGLNSVVVLLLAQILELDQDPRHVSCVRMELSRSTRCSTEAACCYRSAFRTRAWETLIVTREADPDEGSRTSTNPLRADI
jgi:putative flippase GtrA